MELSEETKPNLKRLLISQDHPLVCKRQPVLTKISLNMMKAYPAKLMARSRDHTAEEHQTISEFHKLIEVDPTSILLVSFILIKIRDNPVKFVNVCVCGKSFLKVKNQFRSIFKFLFLKRWFILKVIFFIFEYIYIYIYIS